METHLSLFEAVMYLLYLEPIFILGAVLPGLSLFWLYRKDKKILNVRIVSGSILLYYYLCIVLKHIVGIPTVSDLVRRVSLGEAFINPNIRLIPLANGVNLEFILNILCFIPLGFLCPVISRTYGQIRKPALLGLGISFVIEASQLFTLYRATDSSDLIANALGTIAGCLCYKLIAKNAAFVITFIS